MKQGVLVLPQIREMLKLIAGRINSRYGLREIQLIPAEKIIVVHHRHSSKIAAHPRFRAVALLVILKRVADGGIRKDVLC